MKIVNISLFMIHPSISDQLRLLESLLTFTVAINQIKLIHICNDMRLYISVSLNIVRAKNSRYIPGNEKKYSFENYYYYYFSFFQRSKFQKRKLVDRH